MSTPKLSTPASSVSGVIAACALYSAGVLSLDDSKSKKNNKNSD